MAEMADEEMALMAEAPEKPSCRKGSWALALALALCAVVGLWAMVPKGVSFQKMGTDVIQEQINTRDNTVNGQMAGGDIINNKNYYPTSPHMADSDPTAACTVKERTENQVTYADGGFIKYLAPGQLKGHFFDKDLKQIKNVKDLPRCLTKLWLVDDELGGDVKDLPRQLTNLSLPGEYGGPQLTGDVKDLPDFLQYLDLRYTSKHLTGELKDLPGLTYLDLSNNQDITGEVWRLPKGLKYVNFESNEKIHGNVKDLPQGLKYVNFFFNERITGDVKDLPKGLTGVSFYSNEKITGDVKDLPKGLTGVSFSSNEKITGDVKDLPKGLTHVDFASNKKITGDLSDAPVSVHCARPIIGPGFYCV